MSFNFQIKSPITHHLSPKLAGIYDPYLDTLGGGERYCLALAELLLSLGFDVDFFWEGKDLKAEIEKRFGIKLERVNFVSMPKKLFKRLKILRNYDVLFWISDGSVPLMFAKKNILHFQVPFHSVGGGNFLNKIKFRKIDFVICNSFFTKGFIDKEYRLDSKVIYPPVDVEKFKPAKKENMILSVGRFSQLLQAKNQQILINSFKNLIQKGLKNWRLLLIGGSDVGSGSLVSNLKKMVKGWPVEIKENVSFKELIDYYAKSKIFWAANGYGIDEEKNPERVEHFGITVVEAMAAGTIPLLVKKGGFKEIIEDGKSGFFWETPGELEDKTIKLIQGNLGKLRKNVVQRSKIFSKERFYEEFKKIIF